MYFLSVAAGAPSLLQPLLLHPTTSTATALSAPSLLFNKVWIHIMLMVRIRLIGLAGLKLLLFVWCMTKIRLISLAELVEEMDAARDRIVAFIWHDYTRNA